MAATKAVVGMSGGVDSAFTARCLRERGFEVRGVFLLMHDKTADNVEKARECAARAEIELTVIDAREQFRKCVIYPFIADYLAGRTPNPCVNCNSRVKISMLCEYAKSIGFDTVATGHYAVITEGHGGTPAVFRARDGQKDQSYMLWQLSREELSMLVTPLSDIFKDEVRAFAKDITGQEHYRESQDICFIPDSDKALFIAENAALLPPCGDIIDSNGKVLGRHEGIYRYTVGQRRGLSVALGERAFITAIDPVANTITLGTNDELFTESFTVKDLNGDASDGVYSVCTRYRAKPVECSVEIRENRAFVQTKEKLRAVTAGQSAVFYRGDEVYFGGIIEYNKK